jgi:multiple sugar transport system ATP-binding protein
MNVLNCQLETGDGMTKVRLDGMQTPFQFEGELYRRVAAARHEDIALGVRPEAILVEPVQRPGYVPGEVHIIEPQGAYDILDIRIGQAVVRARTRSRFVTRLHESVWVQLDEARTHFFDKKTGFALPTQK